MKYSSFDEKQQQPITSLLGQSEDDSLLIFMNPPDVANGKSTVLMTCEQPEEVRRSVLSTGWTPVLSWTSTLKERDQSKQMLAFCSLWTTVWEPSHSLFSSSPSLSTHLTESWSSGSSSLLTGDGMSGFARVFPLLGSDFGGSGLPVATSEAGSCPVRPLQPGRRTYFSGQTGLVPARGPRLPCAAGTAAAKPRDGGQGECVSVCLPAALFPPVSREPAVMCVRARILCLFVYAHECVCACVSDAGQFLTLKQHHRFWTLNIRHIHKQPGIGNPFYHWITFKTTLKTSSQTEGTGPRKGRAPGGPKRLQEMPGFLLIRSD